MMSFSSLGVDLSPHAEEGGASIGDLFADLYDALEARWGRLYDRCDVRGADAVAAPRALVAAIRAADGGVPAPLLAWIHAQEDEPLLVAFAVMRVIDAAFARFDPIAWPATWAALRQNHSLTTRARPTLLPGGAPEETGDFSANFRLRRRVVVGDLSVEWRPLPPGHDLPRIAHPRLRVAFLPAITDLDIDFVRLSRPKGAVFEARHVEGAEERIFARFVRAVDHADREDASLLLAPELSFTPALWDRARAWLKRRPRRTGSGVRWLLLGTAATDRDADGRPRNQALLVSRHGEVLSQQNKTRPFSFTRSQQEFYSLREALGGDTTPEHIRLDPRVLVLLESATLGRLAVLICEDLAHEDPGPRLAAPLGVRLYLTPVMDGEFADWRWVSACATWHAWSNRVQVIAVNSLVLPERAGRPAPAEGRAVGVTGPLSAWRPGLDGSPAPWPPRLVHLPLGADVVVAEVDVYRP
ncbi:MAG: hypothetical protein Q8P18_31490 [Pseudomonadota bacterium]|nr:hypothetical protein [Pseudomonadota bacterium]